MTYRSGDWPASPLMRNHIYNCDALELLEALPDESVDCVVTSPPYFGLRDYGVDGQIGLEDTPAQYIKRLVTIFHELKRVLKAEGNFWLNMGDTYTGGGRGNNPPNDSREWKQGTNSGSLNNHKTNLDNVPSKSLLLMPHRLAIALQDDGWICRQDNVWCLSGGTYVYARTQKGDSPMMIRDIARLRPETVKLWNGTKWTQVLGWSKSARKGTEIELVLRSGERISCTPNHQFPTNRGLLRADEIKPGDKLTKTRLPEPELPLSPEHIGLEAAWLAGLYVAEGSHSDDLIQIAGHAKEEGRWEKIKRIAESYGGSASRTISGNKMSIRISGKLLLAIISLLVSGHTAKDKCFSPVVWRYSNAFITELLNGYLSGDGHFDQKNNRWRIGFTRNYNLERDLRLIAARLDLRLVIKPTNSSFNGDTYPSFRGEIRLTQQSPHYNNKDVNEVIAIRKARCREVYDIGVEDEPHLFALSSGILTHNSKPNPMPESVTDRTTRAHEYVFHFVKSQRYYYNADVIKEPVKYWGERDRTNGKYHNEGTGLRPHTGLKGDPRAGNGRYEYNGKWDAKSPQQSFVVINETRNKRSVWTISPAQFRDAHFATFPAELVEICLLAGCPPKGLALDPFMGSGTTALVARNLGMQYVGSELNPSYCKIIERRLRLPFQKVEMKAQLSLSDLPLFAEVSA